jgi:hypothetical protein
VGQLDEKTEEFFGTLIYADQSIVGPGDFWRSAKISVPPFRLSAEQTTDIREAQDRCPNV